MIGPVLPNDLSLTFFSGMHARIGVNDVSHACMQLLVCTYVRNNL